MVSILCHLTDALISELADMGLWLFSVLLTLSDRIASLLSAAGLYLHSMTRCKASCCPRGRVGPSPLIWLNHGDSITPLEPHSKISPTAHGRCVRRLICACFIDSGHLLIQLLVPPLVFVDARRRGIRVPEETFSRAERRDRNREEGNISCQSAAPCGNLSSAQSCCAVANISPV